MTAQRIALTALLLVVVVALALGSVPLAAGIERASAFAAQHRYVAAALFVAAYMLAAVLVLPGSVLTVSSGLLFGLPLGVALASAASTLGASAASPRSPSAGSARATGFGSASPRGRASMRSSRRRARAVSSSYCWRACRR
jgi:uncharacterized membrane protein YdjX (TVP38/TMEM64 family)